ncbi:MAG: hypothetical protein JNM89_06130 [Hyphomicrobiaceae bacterium]|nr:hypothetical protein [Hyphomicrobiaceae bacterium]
MNKPFTRTAALALAAIVTGALASVASAQDGQRRDIRDFRFVNTTAAVIQGAWISLATPRAPWVKIDLSSPIGPNGTREIGMSGWRGSQCYFDVKVSFDDGKSVVWNNVNLCRVTNLST